MCFSLYNNNNNCLKSEWLEYIYFIYLCDNKLCEIFFVYVCNVFGLVAPHLFYFIYLFFIVLNNTTNIEVTGAFLRSLLIKENIC